MPRPLAVLLGSITIMGAMGGCGYKVATFPGADGAQVWSAMVTAAEQPEYLDWRVIENDVWNEPTEGRIEIHRLLRRSRVEPGEKPVREEETWRFQITLLELDPPMIRFFARQAAVPAHVWREATRFFDEVLSLLHEPLSPLSPAEEVAEDG